MQVNEKVQLWYDDDGQSQMLSSSIVFDLYPCQKGLGMMDDGWLLPVEREQKHRKLEHIKCLQPRSSTSSYAPLHTYASSHPYHSSYYSYCPTSSPSCCCGTASQETTTQAAQAQETQETPAQETQETAAQEMGAQPGNDRLKLQGAQETTDSSFRGAGNDRLKLQAAQETTDAGGQLCRWT
jgi:hypothetical protein